MGQERALPPGTEFVRRTYRAPRPDGDHDHCSMCFAKFHDPAEPDSLAEGYTTTADFPGGEAYEWVCPRCFEDFAEESGWKVIG